MRRETFSFADSRLAIDRYKPIATCRSNFYSFHCADNDGGGLISVSACESERAQHTDRVRWTYPYPDMHESADEIISR